MYQGKRSLLGKPCTFSSCIQLLIACSPSSSSGHCYYRNVAAIIVTLYLSSLTKAVPRAALPTAPPTCSCAHKGFSAWGSWWTALCICPWQLTDLPGNWGSHSLGCIPACTPCPQPWQSMHSAWSWGCLCYSCNRKWTGQIHLAFVDVFCFWDKNVMLL